MGTSAAIRVLHLAPNEQCGSGIARYAARFRNEIGRAGVRVEVLSPRLDTPNAVARIGAYCRSAVAASAAGFDIVHAELGGASLGEFYAALAVCKQRGQSPAVCLTLHAPPRAIWWPFYVECIRERRVLRAAVALGLRHPARELESLLIRSAGHVFVLSEAARAAVRAGIGAAKPEISVIPFAAPTERMPAAPAAPSDSTRPLVVGFFGYWYRSKSIEDLLAALAMLRAEQPPVRARL
ncbi:MAG: glycosyltransferase, partial [Solirubrobacteraceae bacterium]